MHSAIVYESVLVMLKKTDRVFLRMDKEGQFFGKITYFIFMPGIVSLESANVLVHCCIPSLC